MEFQTARESCSTRFVHQSEHACHICSKSDQPRPAPLPPRLPLPRLHPVDWNSPTHKLARREPRRGQRAVLRATLAAPGGPLVVYCAHLEVFCGMLARIAQLADIFADSRRMLEAGFVHQAILGDLNTMAHGVARLSRHYAQDRMRFRWGLQCRIQLINFRIKSMTAQSPFCARRSLGLDEAVVWDKWVLQVPDPAHAPSNDARWTEGRRSGDAGSSSGGGGQSASAEPPAVNKKLLAWGLPLDVARDALNPGKLLLPGGGPCFLLCSVFDCHMPCLPQALQTPSHLAPSPWTTRPTGCLACRL